MSSSSTSPQKKTVSLEDAAREIGIGRSTAYAAARRGEIPVIRMGRRLLVSRVALDQLLGAATSTAPTHAGSAPGA